MIIDQAPSFLIVDDDSMDGLMLKQSIENMGYSPPLLTNTTELATDIIRQHNPSVIICDLLFDSKPEGLDLIRQFSSQSPKFIVVTNSVDDSYFEETKRLGVGGHLVKPFHYLSLRSVIDHVLSPASADASQLPCLFMRVAKNKQIRIDFNDILYLYSERNYMFVKTTDKLYTTKRSLTKMQEELDSRFIRIHNSYIINMDHLKSFAFSTVLILNDILPMGRAYRKNLTGKLKLQKQKETA